jgi:hypothetical protein
MSPGPTSNIMTVSHSNLQNLKESVPLTHGTLAYSQLTVINNNVESQRANQDSNSFGNSSQPLPHSNVSQPISTKLTTRPSLMRHSKSSQFIGGDNSPPNDHQTAGVSSYPREIQQLNKPGIFLPSSTTSFGANLPLSATPPLHIDPGTPAFDTNNITRQPNIKYTIHSNQQSIHSPLGSLTLLTRC